MTDKPVAKLNVCIESLERMEKKKVQYLMK